MKKLEEKVAEFESKMHKREEEFRRADNERMRRFFNARFDDIPAAFQHNAGGNVREGFGGARGGAPFGQSGTLDNGSRGGDRSASQPLQR